MAQKKVTMKIYSKKGHVIIYDDQLMLFFQMFLSKFSFNGYL